MFPQLVGNIQVAQIFILSYFHFPFFRNKFNFAVLRYLHFRIQVEWMPYGCWYSPLIVQIGFVQFSKLPMFHLTPQTKSFVHGLFFRLLSKFIIESNWFRDCAIECYWSPELYLKDLQSQLFQAVHFWTYITVDRVSSQVECQIFLRKLQSIGTHVDWWSLLSVFLWFQCF